MRFRALPLALALLAAPACTQSFTPVRELKNLSPESIAKLHTLETLNALPGGDWRFHAGDIPHGESVSLDDSAWQVVPTPQPRHGVKAPTDAVWYRRTIEVPRTLNGYDISGSRIWFQFEADANGPMPEIVYFNGRRVALGDDLEPIVLFEAAHHGDKVLVAVKLLHTVDTKTFTGVNLRIEPLDNHRPNPDDIRTQIIVAADMLPVLPKPRPDLLPIVEQAVNTIDFAALAHADQAAFDASLVKAQTILSQLHDPLATAKIDLAGNSHIDAAWLWPRSETIDVVHRTFATAIQLMNEYPDYTFTQSAAQYSAWIADKYPELNEQIKQRVQESRWEIVGGMWVEPDLNLPGGESLVRQLLVGQRVFHDLYGVVARIGWNPDSFGYNWQLPQIYKRSGLDYFVTQKMHWNDTNQLPFRLFWWESPDGSKVLTYFPTDYAWTDVNPTRLAADFAESAQRNPGTFEHLDLFGVGDHGGGPTRDMLDQATHWIDAGDTSKTLSSSSSGLSSFRAAGGSAPPISGASPLTPDAVPTMRFSTAQHYFDDVQTHLNPDSPTWNYDKLATGWHAPPAGPNGEAGIPTWNDELYFEYHRGVYTSQAHQKANIRNSEVATLNAEKLSSLAWLDGATYPAAELTEDWKKVTFNQFHDLAAGSGIATIYRDAQKDFTEVFNSDDLLTTAALNTVSAHIETIDAHGKDSVPVVALNTLAWPRYEVVHFTVQLPQDSPSVNVFNSVHEKQIAQILSHDAATHTFKVLAYVSPVPDEVHGGIPEMGYAVLHVEPAKETSVKTADFNLQQTPLAFLLSNATLHFAINKATGCINSLTTDEPNAFKPAEFIAPNACGNQLQTFVDNPKNYDAWNIDYGTLDHPQPITTVDSIAVVTDGPLRKTIRIQRTFNKSHITQDISLDSGSDVVKIDTTVAWHEQHILLKAAFPLAATSGKATFEIPFGSIERPTTRNDSFEKAKFEVPALRWADLGDEHQGVSILNDSKYGYDALGNTLRLTLLRSPTWPDPDADQGIQHFTYEIYPHTGSWKTAETVHRGYELNNPLTAQQVFAHTGSLPPTHSFTSIENAPNVILSAVKKAEDADALIFRMYESTGQATTVKLHIPPGATTATETNLMETPQGSPLPMVEDTVIVSIKPYEILTVKVDYPARK